MVVVRSQQMFQLVDHTDDVASVAFSPGAEHFVTGSADAYARIWAVEVERSPQPVLDLKHGDAVSGVDFHAKGTHVCTACADSDVRVWRVSSAMRSLGSYSQEEPTVLRGHTGPAWSCAFSPSGRHVSSTSSDRTIALWDWQRAAKVGVFRGHTHWVSCARFNADGNLLCSASRDRSVRLWDVESESNILELMGHEAWTTCCAFGGAHGAGRAVFSGSQDKVVRQFDLSSGMEVAQFVGHVAGVYALAVSPDGNVMTTASWDGTCRVWSVRMNRQIARLPLTTHSQGTPGSGGGGGDGGGCGASRLAQSRGLAVAMSSAGSIAVGVSGGTVCFFEPPEQQQPQQHSKEKVADNGSLSSCPAEVPLTIVRPKPAPKAAVEDWLVDALLEHLAAETRVTDFLDLHVRAMDAPGESGGAAVGGIKMISPEIHNEYADLMMTVMDEVREAFGVRVEAIAAAVTALAARRENGSPGDMMEVQRQLDRIDAVDDVALFSKLIRHHLHPHAASGDASSAAISVATGIGGSVCEGAADEEKQALELELVQLRAQLEEERAAREREVAARQLQRVAELQARLDAATAKEKERADALAALQQHTNTLEQELAEQREHAATAVAQSAEALRMHAQGQEDTIEAREAAAYRRGVEEMEAAAAQERARRDEHDARVAQSLETLERERASAEASKEAAAAAMQAQLSEKEEEERARKAEFDANLARMEQELAAMRAAANASEDSARQQATALELRIARQEKEERERRAVVEEQHAAMQQQMLTQQTALEQRDAEVRELEEALEACRREEAARRAEHETRFQAEIAAQQKSASQQVAAALQDLQQVAAQLEQQREVESDLRAEMARRDLEQARLQQQVNQLQEQAFLQRQANGELAAKAGAASVEALKLDSLESELEAKTKALREAEKGKAKAKKKTAQTMLEKEKALDDMRAARLADEQKMRMLEKEREAARAERDRLAQALADLDAEQARQAEAARAQACTSGRLCLDISADSGDSSPSDSPSKVGGGARDGRDGDVGGQLQDEKEQLLAEAEQGRAFLIRSHAMERERQEEVLRARMEARSRRRGAARNRWDEASAGGIASDACVPGGMAF